MPAEFGDAVWEGLTDTEKEGLHRILDELGQGLPLRRALYIRGA
jgi:hypothetical protein